MPSSESDYRRSPSPDIEKDDIRHSISAIRNQSSHDNSRSGSPERRTDRNQRRTSRSPPPRHRATRDDSRERRLGGSRSRTRSRSPYRATARSPRSRSRSPLPRFRATVRDDERRGGRARDDSPGRDRPRGNYNNNNNSNRRASPSYDRYRSPRRDDGDRNHHRGDGRDRNGGGGGYDRGRRDDNNHRGGYDQRGRNRDEPDSHRDQRHGGGDYQRNEEPYRGGRRTQEAMPEYSDSRRNMRAGIKFSIWARSPTADELRNRSPSPDREVKKKADKSKKHDSDSDSDSDRDRKRRRKSSKKSKDKRSDRHKSSREKSSRRHGKRHRRSPTPLSDVEEENSKGPSSNSHRRRRSDSLEAASSTKVDIQKQQQQLSVQDAEMEFPDDMWVEKKVEMPEDDMEVGPTPLYLNDPKLNERNYGGALLAGEGSAMATYVQDGKRIPRRGEIGLESTEIEQYEHAGFVMSGSRHQRMNAVRVRKENQVISAEEKRALLIFNQEEKIKRDNKVINEMREMVASKLRSTGHSV
ncbi:hypothetical protein BGX29_007112 [Mortierella sp. GBA35]|nr:hypothetical protein BGX29_007112 [Mortierella sp. GBA35]